MSSFILRTYDRIGDAYGNDSYIVHAWADGDNMLHVIKDNGKHETVCKIKKAFFNRGFFVREELKTTKNVIFNSIFAKSEKFWLIFDAGTFSYGLLKD